MTARGGHRLRLRLPDAVTAASLAVAAVVLLPTLWIAYTALTVSPSRAAAIVFRGENLSVFLNTVVMTAAVTLASAAIAVPLAYLTTHTDVPYRRALSVLIALPLVIPSYIGAFGFVTGFGPRGALQSVLEPYGVESLPSLYGLGGAVLVITLYTYPFVYLTTRAAFRSVDASVMEAARTLDRRPRDVFRRVLLPHARPAILAGSLLVALYALSDFGTPAILRFDVYTRVIYVEYGAFQRDVAALLSLQLVALTVAVLVAESYVRGGRDIRSRGPTDRPAVALGRWRGPATAACLVVPLVALAVPTAVLTLWLVRGEASYASGGGFALSQVTNSVSVAALAAVAAVAASLPLGYAAARGGRAGRLAAKASYVGYAMPGIVLGLALVFLGARTPIYRTVPLLVFGYVVRFLPESVGTVRTSFLQFDARLAEAARSLGSTPWRTFRTVVLPVIAPGVAAGAALVFLTTMRELPVTLLLRPAGFDTLVTQVWSAYNEGFFGQAAVPALLLLGISGLSMVVILSRERYDVG